MSFVTWALGRLGFRAAKPPTPVDGAALFSIVIPTCDRPALLARALASVAQQTDSRFQVIVVDDGEPSKRAFAAEQRNIEVVATEGRIGAAAARNLGMARARTPWIVFLDDDDELLPDFLSNLAKGVDGCDGPVLAITDLLVLDYDQTGALLRQRVKTYRSASTPLGHDIHQALRSGMSGLAINRLALRQAGPLDPTYRLLEDTEWILRLVESGSQIVFISPPGVRVHSDSSLARLSDARHFEQRIAECRRLKARFLTLGGRFPELGALIDAMIAGLQQEVAELGKPASPP